MNSMLVCSGIGSCKRANGILSLVSQTRNAGGGGRPGGAIVFNWKQKKILKITKDNSRDIKLKKKGYFDDIKHLFDESKGDRMYKFEDLKPGFTLPSRPVDLDLLNDKKKVDVTQLFGSHKSFGLIQKKGAGVEQKINFSHGRIFGAGARRSLYKAGRSSHDDEKK